jgi:hypothetical protein
MRLFVFLFASLLSAPVLAGQHAVYAHPGGKKLVVDVADNGFARFVADGEANYCLWRDGNLYLVNREEGPLTVMRITDLVAAVDQIAAEHGTSPAKPAGFDGQVFALFGLDPASPETAVEFVTTREPALQALGRAMEQFLLADMTLAHDVQMAAGTRAIFATGAPLDLGGLLVLVAIDTIDVPAGDTALPAEPKSVAEIVDTLKAGDPLEPLEAVDEPSVPET